MIGSLMSRMGTAENLSIPQLKQAIQDGTLPAYVGIPLLQEKIKQQQPSGNVTTQPPIAQQVMQQADGVEQLPSNLPTETAADGGIMHFAIGGDIDENDVDDLDQMMLGMSNPDYGLSPAIIQQMSQQKAEASQPSGISSLVDRVKNYVSPSQTNQIGTQLYPKKTNGNNSVFEKAMNFVLPHEAGYVNHPNDRGGPTNHGVTQNTLSDYLGRKATIEDVKNLDEKTAKDIYKTQFWNNLGIDKLNPKAQMVAFNAAIASGPAYAKRLIQKHDGDPYGMLNEHTKYMVVDIPKNNPSQNVFVKGWQNRQNDLAKTIESMADGGIASIPRFNGSNKSFIDSFKDYMGGDIYNEQFMPRTTGSNATTSTGIDVLPADSDPNRLLVNNQPRNPASLITPEEVKQNITTRPSIVDLLKPKTTVTQPSISPKISLPRGASSEANVYPAAGDASYLNQLLIESAKDPSYQRYKDAIAKLTQKNPDLMNQVRQYQATKSGIGESLDANDAEFGNAIRNFQNQKNNNMIAEERARKNNSAGVFRAQPNPTPLVNPAGGDRDFDTVSDDKSTTTPEIKSNPYLDRINKMLDESEQEKKNDKYMALLTAGLGMMGGTSPYALANAGPAGIAGVQQYGQLQKDRQAMQANALKNAITLGHYGAIENIANQNSLIKQKEFNLMAQNQLTPQERASALADKLQAQYSAQLENAKKDWEVHMSKMFPFGPTANQAEYAKENARFYTLPEVQNLYKRSGQPDIMGSIGNNVIQFDKNGKQITGS